MSLGNRVEYALKMLNIARSMIEDIEHTFDDIKLRDLDFVRKAFLDIFLAYGFIIDAYVIYKTGRRPSGHHARIRALEEIGRNDLKNDYIMFMARAFARPEYFVDYLGDELKKLCNKVKEFMNKIRKEIEEGKQ